MQNICCSIKITIEMSKMVPSETASIVLLFPQEYCRIIKEQLRHLVHFISFLYGIFPNSSQSTRRPHPSNEWLPVGASVPRRWRRRRYCSHKPVIITCHVPFRELTCQAMGKSSMFNRKSSIRVHFPLEFFHFTTSNPVKLIKFLGGWEVIKNPWT